MRYLFVFLLTGCATETFWYQAGASAREFEMDKGQCEAQAFGAHGLYTITRIFNSCMRGKGWQLQDKQ